ncbi:hypothetical protein DFP72DRAFT_1173116 [Ephemerocybe angulata]|uniref:Uncharacterized protein n=1 Tax=Ephemerocybe angulata TaxID=980116 RepID=A0A8H6HQP9_9AGAR|nr:hypothetical protein DFP72DRAFT_1173116 [Tulosesus angulatus]
MVGQAKAAAFGPSQGRNITNPGLELDERGMGYEEIDWISDAEKIALACDGNDGDHIDLSTLPAKAEQVDEEEHARLRKKFRVWPELHTLRINTRGRSWMSDAHRCVFTAERAPALRHLELELWVDHPIWLWTLPYAQLTHLTLATETADTVLLGIVARCASLESLTITLRDWEGTWKKPQSPPTDQVILTYLKKLSVQIEAYNCLNHRIGRDFLNFIDTPQLESLEVVTRNVDRASCFIHLLKRSMCQIRELRLDFDSEDITDNSRPGLESEPPVYYGEPDSDDEWDSDANDSDPGDGDWNADPVTVLPSGTDATAPAPRSTESDTRLVSKVDSNQDSTSGTDPNQEERNADKVNPPPIGELIEKFNLRELIHLVSPTLKTLAIQSGPMDGSWLHELTAPLLEEVTFVCFGITKQDYPNHDKVLVCGPAHDLAIDLLFWTEAWMKDATAEEKRIRKVSLVGAPAHRVGTQTFYGMSEFDIIRDLGVNLSVWWYKDKRRSERERRAWLKSQHPKDKPASLKREPRIIKKRRSLPILPFFILGSAVDPTLAPPVAAGTASTVIGAGSCNPTSPNTSPMLPKKLMLSPHIKMYNDMPNLVDPNSPASFHAAPPGASSGGQPGGFGGGGYGFGGGGGGGGGFFDAFPGASQQRESPWPPTFGPGTPHPNAANLAPGYPWGVGGGGGGSSGYPGFGGSAPHSAPPTTGWGFNAPSGYPAGGFNNTPALSWGAQTPAGSYGAPVTPGGAPPFGFGGGGYTPWSAPGGGGGFEGFGSGGIAPGGFFGAPSPHYPPWEPPKKEKKRREKRSSSMKRAVSEGPNGQHGKKEGLSRSNSFGHLAGQGAGAGYYPAFSPMGIPTGAGAIGQQEVYGPRNLARRERLEGGLASYLPGVSIPTASSIIGPDAQGFTLRAGTVEAIY